MRRNPNVKDHHVHSRHSSMALLIAKIHTKVLLPWLEDDEYQLHGTGSDGGCSVEADVCQRPVEEGRVQVS